MTRESVPSKVPVKLYRTKELVTVAVPMPGLEPFDVRGEVTADGYLRLSGCSSVEDGAGGLVDRDSKQVLVEEWTPGPYHRDVELPVAVDGEHATMTYGNGVVVVALPIAEQTRAATFGALVR